MKNKITSLILVAAIALLANAACLSGFTADGTNEINETNSIEVCFADSNWYEF